MTKSRLPHPLEGGGGSGPEGRKAQQAEAVNRRRRGDLDGSWIAYPFVPTYSPPVISRQQGTVFD